ncbi:MAG: SMP-30/gluconolactonase/LRE family protein [Bacteroidales bacterium]
MKIKLGISLISGLVGLFLFMPSGDAFSQAYHSDHVKQLWASDQAFKVPESVFYDAENEVLYVSNINGKPTDKDGNGFLSKMSINGKIERLEWITGLNAPKGMNMKDGKLYVADIDRVAEIDVQKGSLIRFFEAENAEFLNDITIDDKGVIYVSDMSTGAVYRIKDGMISEWFPSGTFKSPNGMNFMDGKVYLGTKGAIIAIDPETKAQETTATFEGSVDGLEIDMQGRFVFSDWNGLVRRTEPGGEPEVLFNTTDKKIQAADIHLMREEHVLLVPTFYDNRVVAYKMLD